MEKKNSPATYFRASDIKKQTSQVSTSTACSSFKAHGKTPPWLMRPKSETSNFELMVPSKRYLLFSKIRNGWKSQCNWLLDSSTPGKRNSILAKKDLLLPNATSFIANWKTECEYARGIRYVVASFQSNFWSKSYKRLPAWLSESCRHADQTVAKGKGLSRFWLFKCCRIPNNDHRQTYGESGELEFRGNITSQGSVELLNKCCRISTTRMAVLTRERSLRIQYSRCEKRHAIFFSNGPSRATLQSLQIGLLW